MRAMLSILTSMLILGLGTAASLLQCGNHELAARLDDRQRQLELTRMFILNAEARILAAEAMSRTTVHVEEALQLEGAQ